MELCFNKRWKTLVARCASTCSIASSRNASFTAGRRMRARFTPNRAELESSRAQPLLSLPMRASSSRSPHSSLIAKCPAPFRTLSWRFPFRAGPLPRVRLLTVQSSREQLETKSLQRRGAERTSRARQRAPAATSSARE